jgi:hypothetical protein
MINEKLLKKILKEATSDGGGRGSYVAPLRPGLRIFDKSQLDPFNISVSKFDSPLLSFDSYDGKLDTTKKQTKKIESIAKKSSKYAKNNPELNDDDGGIINPTFGKNLKNSVKKVIETWEKNNKLTINEDLAVWFGKKKKPKGSSQPKGPWVDICRKVDGKHPPCGRKDADSGSYPKCRAAGVAGKMSDSEKKNACQQKRRAEKKDTQTGKGQKPIMTSYKVKKESTDSLVSKIILEIRNTF